MENKMAAVDSFSSNLTVVVCTRNRHGSIAQTVNSILRNDYPNFELIVVDQSDDDSTAKTLEQFSEDNRIRYIRSQTKGVSTARNIGISNAKSDLIALTDDDCEAHNTWAKEIVAALEHDKRIGIVFGNVLPSTYDRASGFITAYFIDSPFMARGIYDKHLVEGIGACMGLRRSVWQALGGFDNMLGAGAPLKSAGETDLTIRALLSGYYVYETPEISVIHYGFRDWGKGRILIGNYMYGFGAMFAKHLKCRYWPVLIVLSHLAIRWAFSKPVVDIGDRPPRLLRLISFIRGVAAGACTPVDRRNGHYLPEPGIRL